MPTGQKSPERITRFYAFKLRAGKGLSRFALLVMRYRNLFLALIVLAVALLGYNIPKLSIATSLESSFKSHNQAIREYQEFRDLFGRDDKIVILIKS